METTRQNKIARLIQKELSEMFLLQTKAMPGVLVSVSVVRISPDMSYARVYLSVFPSEKSEDIVKNINANVKAIRYELGARVRFQLRIIPELKFFVDDSLDYAAHIDELLKLKTAICERVNNEIYRNFFLCAFSNILKPCSRWLTKSIKPQIDPNKEPKNVLESFKSQVKMMRNANLDNTGNTQGSADINCVNFLDVDISSPFVDLVVTSPPYVTSYEYADLHQLSTLWLGFTNDFRTLREGTIGSLYHAENFNDNINKLNETAQDIVSKMYSIDKRKTRSIAQYYIDMQTTVHKVYKMLKSNGGCLFVIGNTEYKGVKIDNAKHLTECLLKEGFINVEVDRRKISNKILTPYRDENGKFAKIKGSSRKIYSEEFVIFARKK